jgi:hypothetical protein
VRGFPQKLQESMPDSQPELLSPCLSSCQRAQRSESDYCLLGCSTRQKAPSEGMHLIADCSEQKSERPLSMQAGLAGVLGGRVEDPLTTPSAADVELAVLTAAPCHCRQQAIFSYHPGWPPAPCYVANHSSLQSGLGVHAAPAALAG